MKSGARPLAPPPRGQFMGRVGERRVLHNERTQRSCNPVSRLRDERVTPTCEAAANITGKQTGTHMQYVYHFVRSCQQNYNDERAAELSSLRSRTLSDRGSRDQQGQPSGTCIWGARMIERRDRRDGRVTDLKCLSLAVIREQSCGAPCRAGPGLSR